MATIPPFRPAEGRVPKSGKGLRIPYNQRNKEPPLIVEADKGRKAEALLWARRLPYKLVQGSHIGHGLRMEPSRKEPADWKEPKRRLAFNEDGSLAAPPATAAAAAAAGKENVGNRRPSAGAVKAGTGKAGAAKAANNAKPAPAPKRAPLGNRGGGNVPPKGAKGGGGGGGRTNVKVPAAAAVAAPKGAAAPKAAATAAAAPKAAAAAPKAGPAGGFGKAAGAAAAASREASSGASSASEGGASTSASVAVLRSSLMCRQMEVECLLRPALDSAAAIAQTRDGVRDALALDDELGVLSTEHEMSKGRLFQALLEELRAVGANHAQTDNSVKKSGRTDYRAEFGEERWAALAQRADALRNLVRIKVADDNDLKTARAGLVLCAEFFDGLAELARKRGATDELEVLLDLALSA